MARLRARRPRPGKVARNLLSNKIRGTRRRAVVEAMGSSGGRGTSTATVDGLLDAATAKNEAAGCESPRADAEAIVAERLGVEVGELSREGSGEVPAETVAAIEASVERRAEHEPLAYVLGHAPF